MHSHVHSYGIRSCGPSPAKTNARALKVGAVSGPSGVQITVSKTPRISQNSACVLSGCSAPREEHF